MAKATKPEDKIFYRPNENLPPLPEEMRKKLFPRVPPPSLRELKEMKNQKNPANEKN